MSNSKPSKAKVKIKVNAKAKPDAPEAEITEPIEDSSPTPTILEPKPAKTPYKIKLSIEASAPVEEPQASESTKESESVSEPESIPVVEPADPNVAAEEPEPTAEIPAADLPVAPIEPAPPQRDFTPTKRAPIGKLRADIRPAFVPMPNPVGREASNLKFWSWAAVSTLVAAGLLASAWPAVKNFGTSQANNLVAMGNTAGGDEAMLDYQLASYLDPANTTAAEQTASVQLSADQATAALATLNRAITPSNSGGLSDQFRTTLTRAQLETGDTSAAANQAEKLVGSTTATQDQLVTAALALAAAGKGSEAQALEPRLNSPQALQRVERAVAGKLTLASELAASGLLRSSSAILESLPDSAARDLLLARIQATGATKSDWEQSADNYSAYLRQVPADATTRLAYATVLTRLKQTDAASHQRSLAASLTGGQP